MSEIVQGSPEWHAIRCGRVTASRVADVVAKPRSGNGVSASRNTYMGQLIAERLTGEPMETYTSPAMAWGTETEAQARAAYEFEFDVDVAQVGFVPHPKIEMSGASPDGLVGDAGLVQIKCPNTATHIASLLGGKIARNYALQMQWELDCSGREWCDFVSFDPRMNEELRLHVQRVERDAECIEELREAVTTFLSELDEKLEKLKRLYRREAA